MRLLVIASVLGCLLTSCASQASPPAIPDAEVRFEGIELGGVLSPVEDRVDLAQPAQRMTPLPWSKPLPLHRPRASLQRTTWPGVPQETLAPAPAEPPPPARKSRKRESLETILRSVTAESLIQPSRDQYFGGSAIARYVYIPGKVYELVTSPQSPSLILLPPGERLATKPALPMAQDEPTWSFGWAQGGEGEQQQETILVAPAVAGLTARLALLTQSGRAYLILLRSTATVSMAGVTWEQPALPRLPASQESGAPAVLHKQAGTTSPTPMVAVNRVHTAWQIAVRKGAPPWAPLSVWDDGQRIVIRFAQALSYTFAPAVAAQGHNGQSVIIESTPWEDGIPEHGSYYLVSGLYPVLVLNDGQGNEVTLTRLTGQARGYQEVGNGTRR